jgi:hypothetical protein
MNTQSSLVVATILLLVMAWLLRNFFDRKISTGQTLFWLVLLVGAEVLTIFPSLIDRVSVFWGNLVPVSWITFAALVFLVFYLLYLTVRLNGYARVVDLARGIAHMERRIRELERERDGLRKGAPRPE